jgi:hypothetical protein
LGEIAKPKGICKFQGVWKVHASLRPWAGRNRFSAFSMQIARSEPFNRFMSCEPQIDRSRCAAEHNSSPKAVMRYDVDELYRAHETDVLPLRGSCTRRITALTSEFDSTGRELFPRTRHAALAYLLVFQFLSRP